MCQTVNEGRFMDIIELDAASNRGIDEVRDIRDKVNFAPVQGRRKVYIIDEAHMLTDAASNAFLKTLEEPPAHVIFVLCTTEAHRILPTIISRCQRLDFRRIPSDTVYARLAEIADAEGRGGGAGRAADDCPPRRGQPSRRRKPAGTAGGLQRRRGRQRNRLRPRWSSSSAIGRRRKRFGAGQVPADGQHHGLPVGGEPRRLGGQRSAPTAPADVRPTPGLHAPPMGRG